MPSRSCLPNGVRVLGLGQSFAASARDGRSLRQHGAVAMWPVKSLLIQDLTARQPSLSFGTVAISALSVSVLPDFRNGTRKPRIGCASAIDRRSSKPANSNYRFPSADLDAPRCSIRRQMTPLSHGRRSGTANPGTTSRGGRQAAAEGEVRVISDQPWRAGCCLATSCAPRPTDRPRRPPENSHPRGRRGSPGSHPPSGEPAHRARQSHLGSARCSRRNSRRRTLGRGW